MTASPDSVIKHDGRNVAFDPAKFERSVYAALLDADAALSPEVAASIASKVRNRTCEQLLAENKLTVSTADLRAAIAGALRNISTLAAEAYTGYARSTAQLLWQVRVIEAGMPRDSGGGVPWDRRRLLDSLLSSGVALDVAGRVAREVERQLVALRRILVTPALIHSLGTLALDPVEFGARAYRARRVAFSALAPVDPAAQSKTPPLRPATEAALEQFWLQCVHSTPVIRAVEQNLLALDPYPATDELPSDAFAPQALDPLAAEFGTDFLTLQGGARRIVVLADGRDRRTALGACFDALAAFKAPRRKQPRVQLRFATPGRESGMGGRESGAGSRESGIRLPNPVTPITINAGALVVREGLREIKAIAERLSELLETALLAHREREQFWGRAVSHGRPLPIAIGGLFNVATWLLNQPFDANFGRGSSRRDARVLRQNGKRVTGVVSGWVLNILSELSRELERGYTRLRESSGARICASAQPPARAAARLWRRDVAYFAHDGVRLSDDGDYSSTYCLWLKPGAEDFFSRLALLGELALTFDTPPGLTIQLPLAPAQPWSEIFETLSGLPVPVITLQFGGGTKNATALLRRVEEFKAGDPLFDGQRSNREALFESTLFETWAVNRFTTK